MLDVKSKSLATKLCAVLAMVALATALGGCAPSQSSSDAEGGADATSYPTGSLKAVHIAGQLEGFNPHKAHLAAGDCITCHSVEGTSTLTCNECHDAPLPEGWQSAERGSGPLHSLTK